MMLYNERTRHRLEPNRLDSVFTSEKIVFYLVTLSPNTNLERKYKC